MNDNNVFVGDADHTRFRRPKAVCSPERASFDSPGCNPGFPARDAIVALKGRHSWRRLTLCVRPHRACLDGEEDGMLNGRHDDHRDPIQLVWMVKEIIVASWPGDLIHHPGKLDGAFELHFANALAHHLVHQSAQGGWGPENARTQPRASGEWRPVGAYGFSYAANPGFRCAPPWAMEYDPLGVGGLRPHRQHRRARFMSPRIPGGGLAAVRSPERASFDSPGCNPGLPARHANVALKGRHSRRATLRVLNERLAA